MQPPIGSFHHLRWVDQRPCLLKEPEEESVELLLGCQVSVPSVQLGQKKRLDPRPHSLLGVCLARVWGLEDDVEMGSHLCHVVKRPMGSVVIQYEDWALKQTGLFDQVVDEPPELGTVCGSRSEEDGNLKRLAYGPVDGHRLEHLEVFGSHQAVTSHPRLPRPRCCLKSCLIRVNDDPSGIY